MKMEKMKKDRSEQSRAWRANIRNTGFGNRRNTGLNKEGILKIENAGAVGIVSSNFIDYWYLLT